MTPSQHLTWDSRPGADGSTVHLPKYSEVEAAEAEPVNFSFTPGPWRFRAPPSMDAGNPWVVMDKDSHVLAIIPRSPREANARLIAAAPTLAAELQRLYEVIAGNENGEYMDGSDCLIRIADVLTVAGLKVRP